MGSVSQNAYKPRVKLIRLARGRATSAAPVLFQPVRISSVGTFQDGGLKHNNPINLALWESRYIWPSLSKPDLVLSLGTGTTHASSPAAPNFRHVVHDGFIPRLWRSFMSSLDGQAAWRDLWNRLDDTSRENCFRLNISLSSNGPAMDDIDRMNELRGYVHSQPYNHDDRERIVFALLTSTFYFELTSTPCFFFDRYFCHGSIRCRLKGTTICQVLRRTHGSSLAFMTERETLGYFAPDRDLCTKCSRYNKQVGFIVRHPTDLVNIYLQSPLRGKRNLSGFPQTMQWFTTQQQLQARFGSANHSPARSCDECNNQDLLSWMPSSSKRKRHHQSELLPRKKRNLGADYP